MLIMATRIGFEPTISALTGRRVKPDYTTGPRLYFKDLIVVLYRPLGQFRLRILVTVAAYNFRVNLRLCKACHIVAINR